MASDIFPRENDTSGNIEYKKVIKDTIDDCRMMRLSTQMKWRMQEGLKLNNKLEAIYYLGINDDGSISNCSQEELHMSIKKIKQIANLINCITSPTIIENYAKVLVTPKIKQEKSDIRVCLLGDSGCGKTTLVSCLTRGELDDGNGSAASVIHRYDHEFMCGLTSSIKIEYIGFKDNNIINYNNNFDVDIVDKSDKIITLIDLPGNTKYFRTTLFGLMAYKPDYAIIFNNSSYYINLCNSLNINYKLITSKYDIEQDINSFSCVTGHNLDKIHDLLNNLQPTIITHQSVDVHFMITSVRNITDVGLVISGIMVSGQISINDKLYIGPINNKYIKIKILSIHIKKQNKTNLLQGQYGSLLIKHKNKYTICKYMNIFNKLMLDTLVDSIYINIKLVENKEYIILIHNMKLVCMYNEGRLLLKEKVKIKNGDIGLIMETLDFFIVDEKNKW